MNFLAALLAARLPPAWARFVPGTLSFVVGLFVAAVIHYVLYRVGLPSKPFIYVAF